MSLEENSLGTRQPRLFAEGDLDFLNERSEMEEFQMSRLPEIPQRKGLQINPEIRLDFVLSALIALLMGGYFMFKTGSVYESRQTATELEIRILKEDQKRQDEEARDKDNRLWDKLSKIDEKLDRIADNQRKR